MDIKLVTQALNCRSTLETENYERLEFLGDAVLKLISSWEVFKLYPKGNRDLLFSKRRIIENNKNLFTIAEKNQLDKFLFSTPVTLKRVSIPGFSYDESLIFNISFNRSFAKNCTYNKTIKQEMKSEKEQSDTKTDDHTQQIENTEEHNDKTQLQVENLEQMKEAYCPKASSPEINYNAIEEVVNNKIEIFQPKSFRIIYNKTLADLVESLTGLVFMTARNEDIFLTLNKPGKFLKELGVITQDFDLDEDCYTWSLSVSAIHIYVNAPK